jgi:hypothetical protein
LDGKIDIRTFTRPAQPKTNFLFFYPGSQPLRPCWSGKPSSPLTRPKKLYISQDKLSNLSDDLYNTNIKRGSGKNQDPTMKTLAKIAEALGAALDDLAKGNNQKSWFILAA